MNKKLLSSLVLSMGLAFAGLAQAAVPVKSGGALVDAHGRTLYTFDKDSAGKSACNGPCASMWPPALATANDAPSGDFSLVSRDDGSKQWAYQGKPVYTYKKDMKTGDANGDNFKDVWHAVKP
ncbi:MAG: COG4315 family predicted lipoprotein [Janthinobacterium lividum]